MLWPVIAAIYLCKRSRRCGEVRFDLPAVDEIVSSMHFGALFLDRVLHEEELKCTCQIVRAHRYS